MVEVCSRDGGGEIRTATATVTATSIATATATATTGDCGPEVAVVMEVKYTLLLLLLLESEVLWLPIVLHSSESSLVLTLSIILVSLSSRNAVLHRSQITDRKYYCS